MEREFPRAPLQALHFHAPGVTPGTAIVRSVMALVPTTERVSCVTNVKLVRGSKTKVVVVRIAIENDENTKITF